MIPLKMGIPNLGVYYLSLTSYKDCHPTSYWQGFFSLVLPTTMGRIFCFTRVSSCMDCYPTTIGKDFFLWLFPQSPPMR